MFITSWIERVSQSLKRDARRKSDRSRGVAPAIERLEEKSLLSAQSFFLNGEIDIVLGPTDSVAVTQNPVTPGTVQVLINGVPDAAFPQVSASAVSRLVITGGDDSNLIDLTGMTAAVFNNAALTIEAHGGNGADTLLGSDSLADSLDGGHGADSIVGNGLNDTLLGDDGNDTITGGNGDDSISAGDGQDLVDGGIGNDTVLAGNGDDVVDGAVGNDSLDGGDGTDILRGGDGADVLNGGAGNDSLDGQNDNDSLFGGSGNDTLLGSAGNDEANGQSGIDSLLGGAGNDVLVGGDNNDSLAGGAGDDTLNGSAGNDILDGADGNDSLIGGTGNDSITGGLGDDIGKGQAGNDTLTGTEGADSLDGGAGNDVVSGGSTVVSILMSINNTTVIEGTGGSNTATFTVSLSSAATSAITVDFTTVNGSAIAPGDFAQTSGTLTIPAGANSAIITVAIAGDSTDEVLENFTMVLSNASGATLNDAVGLCSITDDDSPGPLLATSNALATATAYVTANASQFGLTRDDAANFIVTNQYVSAHNGVTHLYLQQTYLGLPIIDANINVNILADGTVVSAHSSFVPNVQALAMSAAPEMTTAEVFAGLAVELTEAVAHDGHQHGTFGFVSEEIANPSPVGSSSSASNPGQQPESDEPELVPLQISRTEILDRLQWAKTDNGGLELVWTINVQTRDVDGNFGWYDASSSTTTGEVVHQASWVAHASYNVIRFNQEAPLYAPRTVEVDPQDPIASPFGWHDSNGAVGAEFTDTRGNNVFAQSARDDDPINDLFFAGNPFGSGPRPDGGAGLNFNFPFDDTQDPATYLSAATTNLFYTNNIVHDIHYQYGFDEASGNFQINNYGNGGLGNDQVGANAQAGANVGSANNAFMATPPDGMSPTMAMFIFDTDFSTGQRINPPLDSDFENGIIIHEYGHGVSNRLTGGPANAGALQALQSGGMGEGWSDWWALMFTQQVGDQAGDPRPVGNYVQAQSEAGPGIRRFPYSFDMAVDPLTLGNFNGGFPNNEVHNAGEIWASALWDMNWLLINGINSPDCNGNTTPGYGFDPDLYNGTGGNNIALQLVTDGLKLQPANPTFIEARDAILQADMINNGGANQRAIFTAFARRGFGFSASAGPNSDSPVVTQAFDLPPELGAIFLDAQVYVVGNAIGITVCDTDGAAMGTTVNVLVTTGTGDSEMVTLTRQPDQNFFGSILTQRNAPTPGNGLIDVLAESDVLTVTYIDLNDGTGQMVTLQALAVLDAGIGDTLTGSDGNDLIIGGNGNDIISANGGNDTVFGNNGNDSILGGSGNDLLDGQAGDDTLAGQGGRDTLIGGQENDTFQWSTFGDGDDVVSSLGGFDQMQITATGVADTISIGRDGPRIQVTSGGNVLTVNEDIRVISLDLGNGNDLLTVGDLTGVSQTLLTISGGDGNDIVNASGNGQGDVLLRLNGNAGNDTLTGSANNDTIDGGDGRDVLFGGNGNDLIFGGTDNDAINGGSGDDSVTGDDGNDTLAGGDGNDTLRGGLGNDSISGQAGADSLEGVEGRDTLLGGDGNDSLDAGGGKDFLSGGEGADTLDGGRNDDTILGDAGADTIRGNHGNDSIDAGSGDDTVSGGDGNDSINGGDGNDLMTGADGDDILNGAAGNDTLTGSDGNDILAGGGGGDFVLGDDGDDTVKGNGGTNTLSGGQGNDLVTSLASDVINENFVLADDLLDKLDLL
ncbi:MAG: M36 family metallopeptidase [Planctomycetaceae bacterium]